MHIQPVFNYTSSSCQRNVMKHAANALLYVPELAGFLEPELRDSSAISLHCFIPTRSLTADKSFKLSPPVSHRCLQGVWTYELEEHAQTTTGSCRSGLSFNSPFSGSFVSPSLTRGCTAREMHLYWTWGNI